MTRTIFWATATMCVIGCSADTPSVPPINADPPRSADVSTPYPIQHTAGPAEAPETYKGLPLALVDNGAPSVTAVDGVIGVVCVGMSNGLQQCSAFAQRVRSEWANLVSPSVRVANCSVGGHAIERWIDPAYDAVLWQRCINEVLPEAGIRLDQVRVVHHKAANMNTVQGGVLVSVYPAPNSDMMRLQTHLDEFADRVIDWFPSLQAVYTTARSYGGFAPVHRGEPLSYETGHGVNEWLRGTRIRRGVWFGWGAYLWAPDCASGVLTAGVLCYTRSDFVADGVHPSPSGLAKTSARMHERFLQHSWYRRQ